MRLAVLAVTLGTAVLTASPASTQSDSLLARLFQGYRDGNQDIVTRTLVRPQDYRAIERDFAQTLLSWQAEWKPVQAAFALELIIAGLQHDWPETQSIVAQSRDFVVNRPEPIGANPDHDAFELLWHRTVVALLEGGSLGLAGPYLNALAERVSPPTASDGRPQLNDTRFVLQRAQVAEQRIMPSRIAQIRNEPSAPFVIMAVQPALVSSLVDDAIYLLDEAAKYPEIAPEAEVRKAVVLWRLSRPKEALPLLAKVYGRAVEPAVNYLAALVEGRVLEALDRPEDAAEAYKRAVLLFPRAQSPFVAMAALRLKQDLQADALEWASRARMTSADSADPWWEYWMGDFRFVPTWLGAVRKAAQVTPR